MNSASFVKILLGLSWVALIVLLGCLISGTQIL